jgi:ABC-type glycerol-3-phosphate transport system substrate-binding protein
MTEMPSSSPSRFTRRAVLVALAVSPLLAAACSSLPAILTPSTPTPTEPRRVRIAIPNLEAFQFLGTKLHNASNVLNRDRYIKIELYPIDLSIKGQSFPTADEIPKRFADSLNGLTGTAAPDLVMTELFTVGVLGRAGALKELTPLLRGEKWFKVDDFIGNSLQAGQIRGKQIAIPLELSIEALLYSRSILASKGFEAPQPGWTWDQAIVAAKSLNIHQDGPGDRAGFFLTAGSPNWVTMAWQRGAQVISEDGGSIDLSEPGTISALEFLADLTAVHKISPLIDKQMPPPTALAWDRTFFAQAGQLWRALSGKHAAMGSSFVGGFVGVTADDDIKIGSFPAATKAATLGFPGIMLGVPKNAPDVDHSANALHGLLDAAALSMILPTRKGVTDLKKVQDLLLDSEAIALSNALGSIRVLPGDFPLEALAVAQTELVVPILSGQKVPKNAVKEAQAPVQAALAKYRT